MFDKKSDYALNKRAKDSIVYISVTGTVQLNREDFPSEAEFLKWKCWSDRDYRATEKAGAPSTTTASRWMTGWMWSALSSPWRTRCSWRWKKWRPRPSAPGGAPR